MYVGIKLHARSDVSRVIRLHQGSRNGETSTAALAFSRPQHAGAASADTYYPRSVNLCLKTNYHHLSLLPTAMSSTPSSTSPPLMTVKEAEHMLAMIAVTKELVIDEGMHAFFHGLADSHPELGYYRERTVIDITDVGFSTNIFSPLETHWIFSLFRSKNSCICTRPPKIHGLFFSSNSRQCVANTNDFIKSTALL